MFRVLTFPPPQGETFVDLGSGAGIDVFLAARKVGEQGKAIGVDMTDKMLDLAQRNSAKGEYTNVEFVRLPLFLSFPEPLLLPPLSLSPPFPLPFPPHLTFRPLTHRPGQIPHHRHRPPGRLRRHRLLQLRHQPRTPRREAPRLPRDLPHPQARRAHGRVGYPHQNRST